MLDQLEALRALKEEGTTARAAVRLRLTQSAISKRIDALEAEVGAPLIEAHGRGCRLTPAGEALVRDAAPLLASLRDVVASARSAKSPEMTRLRVAASDSLLSSWLPEILARVSARLGAGSRLSQLALELHAHRGPLLVERVRGGDVDIAICVDSVSVADVSVTPLGDEPMVIVPRLGQALSRREREAPVDVWTVEERSLTWGSLEPRLRARQKRWGIDLRVTGRVESFAALVQLARAALPCPRASRHRAGARGIRAGTHRPAGARASARCHHEEARPRAREPALVHRCLARRVAPPPAEKKMIPGPSSPGIASGDSARHCFIGG